MPANAPQSPGKAAVTSCFVDASHGRCQVASRSWTGILILVNRAPFLWYIKRQSTVESSTFSSEFIVAKIALERIEGLRYKLRMMGIPLEGPTNMLCDNECMVPS